MTVRNLDQHNPVFIRAPVLHTWYACVHRKSTCFVDENHQIYVVTHNLLRYVGQVDVLFFVFTVNGRTAWTPYSTKDVLSANVKFEVRHFVSLVRFSY